MKSALCLFRWVAALVCALCASALPLSAQEPSPADALAEVNGQAITQAEVDRELGPSVVRLEEQLYRLRLQRVEELIQRQVLDQEAARRGISRDALLEQEVNAKVAEVTPSDIHDFYVKHKDQLTGEEADISPRLKTYLRNQRVASRREEYVKSLETQANVKILLQAPAPVRVEIPIEGEPTRGAEASPVTIVIFEDFQCPFCRKSMAPLAEAVEHHRGQVRLAHLDFPLESLHPASRQSHEAARCAAAQGKFWEYRDLLYAGTAGIGPDQLEQLAAQLQLNVPAFRQCLASGTYREAVSHDIAEGNRLGVTGTPTFFMNGRPISGAQSAAEFDRLIDQELAAVRTPAQPGAVVKQGP